MMRELPPSLAVTVAVEGISEEMSRISELALMPLTGMIWVTICSSFGMATASLPTTIGFSRVLASDLERMVSVRPSRIAA